MPESNSVKNSKVFSFNQEEENIVAAIALRIRQSLDLEIILDRTVMEVRQFLQTDRVFIYRFEPDLSGVIVAESIQNYAASVFGFRIKDPCFSAQHIEQYKGGRINAVENVQTANLAPCYEEVLKSFDVKANLVVPIVASGELWGLLISHHCQSPRQWLIQEVELLKQLAIQVGIAVQQAELYEQVQSFNNYLEQKVRHRTIELETSVKFESLIRNITDRVRDSLNEPQILQTVTQEIGKVLNIERCKIELYDNDRQSDANSLDIIATVAYEYAIEPPNCQGIKRKVRDFPQLYHQLLQKQSLQFVEKVPELSPIDTQATRLVCPIFDDRGTLGNLWLLRPKEEFFEQSEISLVEQVASQCAIAIRQARLYKQSQTQLEELARLNILKDDFLRTISHELRTPMSSIQLASETLEILLEREIGSNKSATFTRVLDIFRSACRRQNQLVDDLLTLCYIDAKKEIIKMQWIDLAVWLPQILEPFQERIDSQNQTLIVDLESNLPELRSDISVVKRIVAELINNACKYTPEGEMIILSARSSNDGIKIDIINTGVEIAHVEQERVFDKFYRIPHHDPWKFGGTGIGLALVKNLVELLGGNICLQSQCDRTSFAIYLPRETNID
ncbi:GAF domain-containing protein [Waterburya agarophytonicola K14]|uniref:histidine kinase n=1 Tax=Waterburya agarophytonicola KI4 TaxID=2874699 RepID=A0A964BNV5_9CYAN|nr:GAF domain-containing protein [Waterburya agarophytonicola]MCC0175607.1 GAF domain-containing protein [Waterburya agarophytonicola KI4]